MPTSLKYLEEYLLSITLIEDAHTIWIFLKWRDSSNSTFGYGVNESEIETNFSNTKLIQNGPVFQAE